MSKNSSSKEDQEKPEKVDKELRAWLEPSFFEIVDKLKEAKGIKNTTELMRVLLTNGLKEISGENLDIKISVNLKSLQPIIDQILAALKKDK